MSGSGLPRPFGRSAAQTILSEGNKSLNPAAARCGSTWSRRPLVAQTTGTPRAAQARAIAATHAITGGGPVIASRAACFAFFVARNSATKPSGGSVPLHRRYKSSTMSGRGMPA